MADRVVFYADGTVLEFEPTEVIERPAKQAEVRTLTGGRRIRVVAAPSDSMRRSGRRDWEVTFEKVPQHFKHTLERIRVFDAGPNNYVPALLRTTFGAPESGYTIPLMPNTTNTPSGQQADTLWFFPWDRLVAGTVRVWRSGIEIEPDDAVTPYTVHPASGTVEFETPVPSGYAITGAAEYAASGYFDDWQAQSLPGYETPCWDIRAVFREV